MDGFTSAWTVWGFVLAVAAHNLEEGVALPSWSRRAGIPWVPPVRDAPFRFAAAVLTVVVVAVAVWALAAGAGSPGHYLLLVFAVGHGLNVVVPHALVTALSRRYMPGLGTGVALVLPAAVLLTMEGLSAPEVSPLPLAVAVALGVPCVLAAIPLLLKLGGRLFGSTAAG